MTFHPLTLDQSLKHCFKLGDVNYDIPLACGLAPLIYGTEHQIHITLDTDAPYGKQFLIIPFPQCWKFKNTWKCFFFILLFQQWSTVIGCVHKASYSAEISQHSSYTIMKEAFAKTAITWIRLKCFREFDKYRIYCKCSIFSWIFLLCIHIFINVTTNDKKSNSGLNLIFPKYVDMLFDFQGTINFTILFPCPMYPMQ